MAKRLYDFAARRDLFKDLGPMKAALLNGARIQMIGC